MADTKIKAIQAYMAEHQLEQLLKDLMAAVLYYKPKRPFQFMINALSAVQTHRENGMPFDALDLFHELARKSLEEPAGASTTATASGASEAAAPPSPSTATPPRTTESPTPSIRPRVGSDALGVRYNMGRRGSVSAESLRPSSIASAEKIVIPKTDEAKIRIASSIANNLLFRNLEKDQRQEVVDAMFERSVKAGEVVIKQGDEGDNFYVVSEGRFEVFVNGNKVVEIGEGGSFGELALMYNTPRAATVVAKTDALLWAVDRVTFRRIIMNNTFRKRKMYESFITTVPILQSLEPSELVKVADALEPCSYDDGDDIIEEGDVGDCFYIILEGEAVVTKNIQHQNEDGSIEEQTVELNRLKKGDYFGELALLTDRPRAATVTAVGDVQCVCLDTKAFIRLLGPVTQILKRNAENYRKYTDKITKASQPSDS